MSTTPKLWGYEELIHASEEYWMKRLVWSPDVSSSFHYHQIKDESWYVVHGIARVLLMPVEVKDPHAMNPFPDPNAQIPKMLESGQIAVRVLSVGDSLHLPPYMAHQVIAGNEGFAVIEASTKHTDADVIRIAPSLRRIPAYV